MNTAKLPAFKAYDIRGKVPSELNETMAYWLGRGFARTAGAKTAVIGMDVRETSPLLRAALAHGLADESTTVHFLGADATDICGTEEVYFATGHGGFDLGLMVTASHNPLEYNGIKPILAGGAPFTSEHMAQLHTYTVENLNVPVPATTEPAPNFLNLRPAYVQHMLSQLDLTTLKPLKIVINAGNGAAGPTADALLEHLPFEVIRLNHTPDATFPNGIPNPLLPANRHVTAEAVRAHKADLGIAWDGDFDRCFLFDEEGTFVPCYYLLSLLAEALLPANPGATIVHDPRLYWDTRAVAEEHNAKTAISRVGHVFFKRIMRENAAILGGEVSGHFYFSNFYNCDTGMLPWLLITQLISRTGQSLGTLWKKRATTFVSTDELNFRLSGPASEILADVEKTFPQATFERVDGVGLTQNDWRANIRTSNTEPLLRLNIEATGPQALAGAQQALTSLIESHGAHPADH